MEYRYLFPGMLDYPPALGEVWPGAELPVLTVSGNAELMRAPLVGFLSSAEVPPDLILPAFDLAMRLKAAGVSVAGGFQSDVERACLAVLLGGCGQLVICPARSLDGMCPAPAAVPRLKGGTLVYASAERARTKRPTTQVAMRRNDVVIGLGMRLLVVSAPPGSRVLRSAAVALEAGRSVACFDHRRNRDLLLLGAVPIAPDSVGIRPTGKPSAVRSSEVSRSESILDLFEEATGRIQARVAAREAPRDDRTTGPMLNRPNTAPGRDPARGK